MLLLVLAARKASSEYGTHSAWSSSNSIKFQTASSAANASERRESLYDELEDTGEGSQGATVAAPAARKAFWGAPRAPMTLALSTDDGLTWPWQRNLEVGDGWCMSNDSEQGRNREYSYPSLRQDADGTLHLAYTVFRQHIRHVRLQPDWATQQP